MRFIKNLNYPRQLAVQDAIFWFRKTHVDRDNLTRELLRDPRLIEMKSWEKEAVQIIRKQLSVSEKRARDLVWGRKKLTDFYEADGRAKTSNHER